LPTNEDEYNKQDHAIFTCAAWNQFMTTIVTTKPNMYPRNALLKYWLPFPLDTSNRKANATKIPERENTYNTMCKFKENDHTYRRPLYTLVNYEHQKFTFKWLPKD
jgi:hypothetical protein